MKTRADYLRYRERFTPTEAETIFVLESPPEGGKYFYDPAGRNTEPLFKAMMSDVLDLPVDSPSRLSKEAGLTEFAIRGFLLVDATYAPVNGYSGKRRNETILRDLPLLIEDLREHAEPATRIVLVKVNVCDLLESKLTDAGFHVLNRGIRIPFPANGNQTRFRATARQVLGLESPETD